MLQHDLLLTCTIPVSNRNGPPRMELTSMDITLIMEDCKDETRNKPWSSRMPKERFVCFPDFKPEFYHYL